MFVLPIPENVIQNPVKDRIWLVHEVDSVIHSSGFVLKDFLFNEEPAMCVDTAKLNLVRESPSRSVELSITVADAIIFH